MWWKRIVSALRLARQYITSPLRGFSVSGGIHVNEDSAMRVSAFYRGVIYISSQIAKLPWDIKDKDNKILETKLAKILKLRPNPEMGSMSFRLCMIQNAIIHGNSYAEIERDFVGRVVALWPINPGWVYPYRVEGTGELVYKIAGGSRLNPGQDVYIPANDIFHVKNFHTKDGIVGQGVVAYATDVLGINLGADRMAGNLFANGGMPSGVISVEGKLSKEAFDRMKADWKESNGGKKSGGTAILTDGAKFSPIMLAPDILQFLESRKFSVIEICRFLGLPPTKLFDTEAATYNNVENANLEVATDTLDSWARMLEEEADIKILSLQYGGNFTEFDLYEVFRGDMTTRSNYFSKMMQSAAITPNEIRRKEGLAPYPDGNRYYVAVNNFSPADRIDDIVDAQIAKSKNSGQGKTVPATKETGPSALETAATKFLSEGK